MGAALVPWPEVLPGRVAVLMDSETKMGAIELPSDVSKKLKNLELPPYTLRTGTVVSTGVSELPLGMRVACKPILDGGLIIEHNDVDHEFGALVPKGQELWIYGPHADWPNQILLNVSTLEAA